MHKRRKFITRFCKIFNFSGPIKLEIHSIRPAKQNMLPTAGIKHISSIETYIEILCKARVKLTIVS